MVAEYRRQLIYGEAGQHQYPVRRHRDLGARLHRGGAATDADAHSCTNAHARTYAYANPFAYSNANARTNAHTCTYANTNSNAHPNAYAFGMAACPAGEHRAPLRRGLRQPTVRAK